MVHAIDNLKQKTQMKIKPAQVPSTITDNQSSSRQLRGMAAPFNSVKYL